MSETGGCRCGSVTYELKCDGGPHIYVCHCLHCQTWSGSAFSEHAMLPASSFSCVGPTSVYAHETEGVSFEDVFCQACGTRIYNRNSALPEMIFLRAGTLSNSDRLEPMAHIWTRRKQPWIRIPENLPAFEESPTAEEFGQAVLRAQARRASPR